MKRTLTLTAEHLTELTTDELGVVVGGTSVPDLPHTLQIACLTTA